MNARMSDDLCTHRGGVHAHDLELVHLALRLAWRRLAVLGVQQLYGRVANESATLVTMHD